MLTHESAGKCEEAVQRYLEATRIDDRFADLHYRLGRCYQAIGNYAEARNRYIQALNLDTLRFRADTEINNIIRSIADSMSSEDIYLVDTERKFEEKSPHGAPGNELFDDHVHMNFRGNYILARSMFKQVSKILPDWVRRYVLMIPYCRLFMTITKKTLRTS